MKIFLISIFLFVLTGINSCTPNPYAKTNRQYKKQARSFSRILRDIPTEPRTDNLGFPRWWVGTTNFNMRKPNFVIIHHTAQNSCAQTLETFTIPRTQVSAHYVICKDGRIHHMLNDYLRAWHAGISKWGSLTDVNSSSIGIEIDNNGFEPFTDPQLNSLMRLLDTLKKKYTIPASNFIGHSDIAPSRKVDPNIYFPWKRLADSGFGLWYADTTGIVVPESLSNLQALRIIGYDVKDSTAAISAFKRHFLQDSISILYEADRKILYNLSRLY
ncbi:MAG: N-acetylmuramoyl-L-alanine amidase [Chitinophagaceae bacterium]